MTQQDEIYDLGELQNLIQGRGLNCKRFGGKYLISQCLKHEDRKPSMQVFEDGWCNCLAGCGRFNITSEFPELRKKRSRPYSPPAPTPKQKKPEIVLKPRKITNDLFSQWQEMPLIPRDHKFKNIPLEVLDGLGWRWDKDSYFLPYFNQTKTAIPFAQWRHLSGERRFTFLKDASPTIYGWWNVVPDNKLFCVEGSSDGAALELCGVPWVALPSAASTDLMKKLGIYCKQQGIGLIYAGDNDTAGEMLREALDQVIHYRVCQAPKPFKDWCEFLGSKEDLAEAIEMVQEYCFKEL